MTEIFEKNVKAMEKWYPGFAEEVRSRMEKMEAVETPGEESEAELEIEEEVSWDGEMVYRAVKDGRKLYLNGKRDAGGAVSLWQERLGELHKYAPVFLVGLGSGLYLKSLCAAADDTVTVLVYEPSLKIFLHTVSWVDLSSYLEKRMVAWAVEGITGDGLELFLDQMVTLENVGYFRVECHPNYQELFPEQVKKALKMASERIGYLLINENTKARFASRAAKNQIRNMKYVAEGYNTLGLMHAMPKGSPAILVSAGPSLNKNIGELSQAKGRASILAVDTAVKPLLKAGIVPDAFATIDGKKPLDLVDMEQVKDIPVIAPSTANADLIERQRGKKIFYNEGEGPSASLYATVGKELPDVDTGGSVACSGFSALQKMRFSPIILVGQDLAHTGGKSHADGTFQNVMPVGSTDGMIMVKGNCGGKVPTTQILDKYRLWFEGYIRAAKKTSDLRVINATEGGAWIEGTERMSLHDAIEKICTGRADFEEAIRNMDSSFTEEEKGKAAEYLAGMADELLDVKKEAGKLQAAYKKMQKLSKSRNTTSEAYLKILKRIKKLSSKCESATVFNFIRVSMPVADYIVRTESLEDGDNVGDEIKAAASQGIKYAGFIQECAQLLHDFMQEELKGTALGNQKKER